LLVPLLDLVIEDPWVQGFVTALWVGFIFIGVPAAVAVYKWGHREGFRRGFTHGYYAHDDPDDLRRPENLSERGH
jgi:hypothetical protein